MPLIGFVRKKKKITGTVVPDGYHTPRKLKKIQKKEAKKNAKKNASAKK